MGRSLCTDREYWKHLDKSEERDSHIMTWCIKAAEGRLCKKTMAQIYFQARQLSTPEAACRFVLLSELREFKRKERKAFIKAYNLARAWYDQKVQDKLLREYGFHQNAKVIEDIRRLNAALLISEKAGTGVDGSIEVLKELAKRLPE